MVEPATGELGGIIVSAFQVSMERIVFKVEVSMCSFSELKNLKGINCLYFFKKSNPKEHHQSNSY